jgi:hypothetical protein
MAFNRTSPAIANEIRPQPPAWVKQGARNEQHGQGEHRNVFELSRADARNAGTTAPGTRYLTASQKLTEMAMQSKTFGIVTVAALAAALAAAAPVMAAPHGRGGGRMGGSAHMSGMGGHANVGGHANFAGRSMGRANTSANFGAQSNVRGRSNFAVNNRSQRFTMNSGNWNGRDWRHHRRHGGRGFGSGFGLGFATGAFVGSAPYWDGGYPYGYYDDYAYDDGYYGDAYAAAPAYSGGSVAYCEQRYRSYDPSSGTYLGYDGLRHPCP